MAPLQTQAIVNEHSCPSSSAHATPSLALSYPCYSAVQQATLREEAHAAGLEINLLKDQPFGAEVVGLDLMHKPITSELVSIVRKALLTHQVLVFRGQQELTPKMHIEFSRHFGVLYRHALGEYRLPAFEEIVVVSNEMDSEGKLIGLNGIDEHKSRHGRRHYWHSDLSYMPAPPMGSMLHMKVMPADGSGDTLFADMTGAYECLPSERQQQLLRLKAKHLFHKNASKEVLQVMSAAMAACLESVPDVCHPVVRTHPETGRKSLFVSEGFTTHIEGLEEGESQALLEWLYAYTTQEKFVYRHTWREGDMVFWDNRSLLHFATGSQLPRTLYRTTIKGKLVF